MKLLSGSLSNQNPGNQFGHAAPIFTIILLCVTAVLQITCLNRGLKVYDSTLVVPVFYGVYTATGQVSHVYLDPTNTYFFPYILRFLNSLVKIYVSYWTSVSLIMRRADIQRRSRRLQVLDSLPDIRLHPCPHLWSCAIDS